MQRELNLTLRQLRAFVAVADRGSFTEAAKLLNGNQSALSILVRELEAELGVRVFDRHSRHVALSEAGQDLYPYAQRVLNEVRNGVFSVGQLRDQKKGLLRIAAPQLLACTLIPRAIASYSRHYPQVEIRLMDTLPERVLASVLAGEVEIAIGPDVEADLGLKRRLLLRDKHWLVCRSDHEFAKADRVTWDQVAQAPFISPTRDFRQRLKSILGFDPCGTRVGECSVSCVTTALAMVAAGLGVSACPTYAGMLAKAYSLELRPLGNPEFLREVCIFTQATRQLSPAAAGFVEFLIGFANEDIRILSAQAPAFREQEGKREPLQIRMR